MDEDNKKLALNDKETQLNDPDFIISKSSTSCKIADIKNFIINGQTSRFWMLRKHYNSLSKDELVNAAFYSWECITL